MHIQKIIRFMGRVLMASAAALLAVACQPRWTREQEVALLRGLTDAHFRDTTLIRDDNLDFVATFTTDAGFVAKTAPPGYYFQDEFLRAFIDKRTGKRTFQLYFIARYPGPQRLYVTANYETASGPKEAVVSVINRNKSCERSQGVTYCDYSEELVFPLDESIIRMIADRYGKGDPPLQEWHYKFFAHSGNTLEGVILPAEAKGLPLEAMEAHELVK